MILFERKKLAYLTLLCFTGHIASSVAAPYQKAVTAEKVQQYIIYPPVQGEALEAIAERFSLPVSTLTALREQFQAYGWSSTAVLVPYSPLGEARLYNNYLTYQLKPGETLTAIASKFNRSTRELSVLNGQVMPASKLAILKAGDVVLVPGPVGSAENGNLSAEQLKEQDKLTSAVAQEIVGAAQLLGANQKKGADPTGMLTQRAVGGVTGGASREIEKFLGANGTAKVGIQANVNGGQVGYSLDYLQPLYERDIDIVFAQIGARTFGERNLANVGLGYRKQVNPYLVMGVNSFLDQDMSRNHTRGGIGGEAWTDQARFSANYYTPLSGWKHSNDHRLNSDPDTRILQERAAKGWDANVETAMPGIQQLSLSAKYFQWNGDRVDVSGSRSQTEKNPKGYTLGAKYQPIPLLNLNAQHTKVTGGDGGWELGMGLTWDFDKSLNELLDPKKSIALRPLAQAKTDIVNRNYNIVLEYQEKDKYAPLTFASSSMSMMVGAIDPGMRVQGGREGLVTYSSSDPLALSVDSVTGVLSAFVLGTVTITAVEHDGAGKVFGSASYTVTVIPNTLVPTVNVTAINGILSVGSTLTGVYVFASNGGDPTDKSTMVWLNGGHTDTNNTYLLDSNDVGSVLTFQVTAQNGAGIIGNTSSMNTASSINTQIPVVTIKNQAGNTLSGAPLVGDVFTAMVECATSCSANTFNYQWEEETAPNSGVYVDVVGAMEQTFTIQPRYQLKRIRVTVDSKKVS
ncbi:ZirU family protein [Pseudomonas proteolytica]|uniref:ZirU family protein n=1 Tax=Pseudomonas proteolytica TaxID=219574 RepID=UPI0023E02D6B|nr:ZirU family protein [Pseudomonas proteolytica]MDF3162511.1 ZirU family protein [Pseudomonas proteolytica]